MNLRRQATEGDRLAVRVRKARQATRGDRFELDVSFGVGSGVTVLFGPSGAGKSTLLSCLAGLVSPDEGHLAVDGRLLYDSERGVDVLPARRGVAMVFQELALFPHLRVEQNITYGLRRVDPGERADRAAAVMDVFRIAHLRDRRPDHLSGGERQRVAFARALVTEPSILLLDEALSSLDVRTKARIMEDLQDWNRSHDIPILFVTHDVGEAEALGDRLVLLADGHVVDDGPPSGVLAAQGLSPGADGATCQVDAIVVDVWDAGRSALCEVVGTSVRIEVAHLGADVGTKVRLALRARPDTPV